jgi:methylenetetrahydrofolate reductase (NADPH)
MLSEERMAGDITTASPEGERARIVHFAANASIEVSARDTTAAAVCRDLLPSGASIYINFAAADTHHGIVAAATRLRHAGFNPVPHVAGRYLASFTQLNDYLARARGEAGVDQVLLVAGDIDRPVGPFQTSFELLATGLFEKHGIRRIGVAGYPEPHPKIDAPVLAEALRAKLMLIRQLAAEPYVVAQFCLDAALIRAWLQQFEAWGLAVPVHVGLAGPTGIATLAKYAVRCGIGNSIRALLNRQTSVARLLVEAGPEPIIRGLAATPDKIAGMHFFSFGGVERTAAWLHAMAAGEFELADAATGFRVSRPRAE